MSAFFLQVCLGLTTTSVIAQTPRALLPNTVPLLSDDQPPGVIGAAQLHRNPQLCGYMQPVELRGPKGTQFSFATDGMFGDPIDTPARVALLVGVPYRVKITGIPFQPEAELYPTLELIDRTYPPPEKAHRFPVPIEFDALEFESAMQGDMVSRVVYLEDSSNAEPVSYVGPQRVYDAIHGENMLQTADVYGRPLAIVRLGSIVPSTADGFVPPEFLFGSPPVAPLKPVPDAEALYQNGIFRRYEAQPGVPSATPEAKTQLPEQATRHAQSTQRIGDSK